MLVWVGKALQKHFLLRSKYRPLFGSLVWGGLGLLCFITEMDRNDGSITEIFFLLESLAGAWGVLVWVGEALQKLFLYLRDILPVPPFNNLFNN